MTFCLGLVRDHWALVASDTRTQWVEYDGDRPEPWKTPVLQVVDGARKLFALPTGWLLSSPSVAWRDGALHAMRHARTLPQLLAAYRAYAGPAMAALAADVAADVRRRQTTILAVRTDDGFAGAGVDWEGNPKWPVADLRGASIMCPDGIEPAIMKSLIDGYQVTVEHERDLRRVVRVTAQLFAAVRSHTGPAGSVSGDVAIGLLDSRGQRLIGPCPHAELLGEEVPC